MRKIILVTAVAAALVVPAAARASPIRECGAAWGVYNITTRNVSCHDARHFVILLGRQGLLAHNGWIRLPGWHTYWATVRRVSGFVDSDTGELDFRATRTSHVIRFQFQYGD